MVKLSQRILVSAPRDTVRRYLQDIGNLPRYERKAHNLEIMDKDHQGLSLSASGKFLGLPWRGQFRLDFTPDGGYRAHMTRGPIRAMTSTFNLRPVTGGTLVTHEEHYHFPLILRPVMHLFKTAIRQTLDAELRVIQEGAEMLCRQSFLRTTD
ncbi:MAG: SRPBCC family protein [Elusimicrobiota bacterium]|jgi:hypothetical protein